MEIREIHYIMLWNSVNVREITEFFYGNKISLLKWNPINVR